MKKLIVLALCCVAFAADVPSKELTPLTADETQNFLFADGDLARAQVEVNKAVQQYQAAAAAYDASIKAIFEKRHLKMEDATLCKGPDAKDCLGVKPRTVALVSKTK